MYIYTHNTYVFITKYFQLSDFSLDNIPSSPPISVLVCAFSSYAWGMLQLKEIGRMWWEGKVKVKRRGNEMSVLNQDFKFDSHGKMVQRQIVGSVQKKVCETPGMRRIVPRFEGLNLAQDWESRPLLLLLLRPCLVLTLRILDNLRPLQGVSRQQMKTGGIKRG